MELKLLNTQQKEEVKEWLKNYKFVYLCNQCGSLYGSDNQEKFKLCVTCENKLRKKKKEENK